MGDRAFGSRPGDTQLPANGIFRRIRPSSNLAGHPLPVNLRAIRPESRRIDPSVPQSGPVRADAGSEARRTPFRRSAPVQPFVQFGRPNPGPLLPEATASLPEIGPDWVCSRQACPCGVPSHGAGPLWNAKRIPCCSLPRTGATPAREATSPLHTSLRRRSAPGNRRPRTRCRRSRWWCPPAPGRLARCPSECIQVCLTEAAAVCPRAMFSPMIPG